MQTIERSIPRDGTEPTALTAVLSWTPTTAAATVVIVSISISYAFATFFARQLTDDGLSATMVAFARFAITAAVLGRFVRFDRHRRRATIWGLASGAAMALGWIAYVRAIEHGDVATVGVVYMTYPLFTLVAMGFVFRVRPTLRQVAGGVLVLSAAAIAIGLGSGAGVSVVAFAAPASFGFAIAVLTERLGALDPLERLGAVAVGAAVGLSPLLISLPSHEVAPASLTSWAWIAGIGVGCGLVPMTIYATVAPHLGAARSAVAGSAELPTVFLIGALFFGEGLRPQHVVAGVIVGAAIVLTSSTRNVTDSPRQTPSPQHSASFQTDPTERPATSGSGSRSLRFPQRSRPRNGVGGRTLGVTMTRSVAFE